MCAELGTVLTFCAGLPGEGPRKLRLSILIFQLISLCPRIARAKLLLVAVGVLLSLGLHGVRQVLP